MAWLDAKVTRNAGTKTIIKKKWLDAKVTRNAGTKTIIKKK